MLVVGLALNKTIRSPNSKTLSISERGQKGHKSQEIKWEVSSSRLRCTWQSLNNSNNGHLHWAHTKQALSTVSHRSRRSPWDLALYYWLTISNGKWGILVLSCGPTAEPNSQKRAPNLWSYQWLWLNLVGHKKKKNRHRHKGDICGENGVSRGITEMKGVGGEGWERKWLICIMYICEIV